MYLNPVNTIKKQSTSTNPTNTSTSSSYMNNMNNINILPKTIVNKAGPVK